jgi:hypothetical protein
MNTLFATAGRTGLLVMLSAMGAGAWAAEGFQLRYNLAGTLGGEMFAPAPQPGLVANVALTHVRISKVTGDDGQTLRVTVPGGAAPLPAPAPAALYPTYGPSTAQVDAAGTLTQWNFNLAWLGAPAVAGGHVLLGLNLPYARKSQGYRLTAATPALSFSPAVPAPARAAATAGFGASYQAALAAQAAAQAGEVSGVGDLELQAGWLRADERLRLLAAAVLVVPTGQRDGTARPDISVGNFYTLRPTLQAAWQVTPSVGMAGKASVGLNSPNRDSRLRSGNWAVLEAAAAYRTPLGPVGLHLLQAHQLQDDRGNPYGASRFAMTGAGVFMTTRIPVIDAALNLQYLDTLRSRNAKHGSYMQLRLTKVF